MVLLSLGLPMQTYLLQLVQTLAEVMVQQHLTFQIFVENLLEDGMMDVEWTQEEVLDQLRVINLKIILTMLMITLVVGLTNHTILAHTQ
jgi:hypothetical protein